jgi:hypothetical protein
LIFVGVHHGPDTHTHIRPVQFSYKTQANVLYISILDTMKGARRHSLAPPAKLIQTKCSNISNFPGNCKYVEREAVASAQAEKHYENAYHALHLFQIYIDFRVSFFFVTEF